MTSSAPENGSEGSVRPSWRIATLAAVILVWLGVAGAQVAVSWHGDRTELLLLIGGNAFLTTAGAWLFHLRWLATSSRRDRRIRNAYLPMAAYFVARFAVAPLAISESALVAADGVAWLLTQAAAVTVLLLPVRDELDGPEHGQAGRSAAAIAAALATTAALVALQRAGWVAGVQPAELGLAVAFAAAAVLILAWRRDEGRDLWLGVAMMLVAGAHSVLAMSRLPYDSSVMWGLVLLGIALSIPIIGATGETAVR
ncbi:MAG TPA: hypothetical protein VLT32_03250, partial [Candidatus Sulfomarinibacteraceae bacterium]|nr:hypothetical protein [Candidatus Sulfomarinibacteraceae bacterium]